MTSTTDFGATDSATLEAERYLREVAPHLAALPAEERADLLEDLAQHLREIAAEEGPPLAERLGPPEAYAAELLASAGVMTAAGPSVPLLARASALVDRGRASWAGQELHRLRPVLRPAWWVLRAYLAVAVLATLQGHSPTPPPALAGSRTLGLVAVLAAIPLSARLGERPPRARSAHLLLAGANVALALYGISLLGDIQPTYVTYADSNGPVPEANGGCLADGAGNAITNLYAYDSEGRLLDPVLLYDQDGRPIDNLCPDVDGQGRRLSTEYRQDANGAPVINAFPRRQTAILPGYRLPNGPGMPNPPMTTVPVRPPAVVVPRLSPTTTTVPPPSG